jgi:hypothetical protein
MTEKIYITNGSDEHVIHKRQIAANQDCGNDEVSPHMCSVRSVHVSCASAVHRVPVTGEYRVIQRNHDRHADHCPVGFAMVLPLWQLKHLRPYASVTE